MQSFLYFVLAGYLCIFYVGSRQGLDNWSRERRTGSDFIPVVSSDVHIVYQKRSANQSGRGREKIIITISLIDIDHRPAVERV